MTTHLCTRWLPADIVGSRRRESHCPTLSSPIGGKGQMGSQRRTTGGRGGDPGDGIGQ